MIEALTGFLKEINADKELLKELATFLMKMKVAFMREGFTEEQAITMVCQMSNNLKSQG